MIRHMEILCLVNSDVNMVYEGLMLAIFRYEMFVIYGT